jgi:hypothetical protein
MARGYRDQFGALATKMKWDDPTNGPQLAMYKWTIIIAALSLLALAFHFVFGTIQVGNS